MPGYGRVKINNFEQKTEIQVSMGLLVLELMICANVYLIELKEQSSLSSIKKILE